MNTATIITLTVLGIMLVDACPIVTSINGSCCEVKSNRFKFSTSPLKSRVYNITNFCGDCEAVAEGYCDAVTDVSQHHRGMLQPHRGTVYVEIFEWLNFRK